MVVCIKISHSIDIKMPFGNREAFQLGLILLCVPVQHFLVLHFDGAAGRTQQIFEVFNSIRRLRDSWFTVEGWKQRWFGIVSSLVGLYFPEATKDEDPIDILFVEPETCPPVDIIHYRRKQGWFGSSTEVRAERPSEMKYRVGQVVWNRAKGVKAVIVGWDTVAKAPEKWLRKKYYADMVVRKLPHYIILVDDRDVDMLDADDFIEFSIAPEMYVSEAVLEVLKDTEIQNAEVEKRFQYFDGAQYIPGPTLKARYPMD